MELFEGAPRRLPVEPGSATFAFSPLAAAEGAPAPIRHLAGYEPFVAYLRGAGLDPAGLRDPLRLGIVLAEHGRGLRDDPALASAAGVFFGNVLVGLLDGAYWIGRDGELGSAQVLAGSGERPALTLPIAAAAGLMDVAPGEVPGLVAELLDAWMRPPRSWPVAEPRAPGGEPFVRPELPEEVFLDDDGESIPYGRRWRFEDGPPEQAYSRVSHPERFAGVHVVADALIAYLEAHYLLRRTEGPELAAGFEQPRGDWLRVVRLEPESSDGAPVLIGYTGFPGVVVHAGAAFELWQPFCGCDACDETAASAADELERAVLGVAAGGLAETFDGEEYASTIVAVDRSSGSRSARPDAGLAPAAVARLAALPHGWQPWPERPALG